MSPETVTLIKGILIGVSVLGIIVCLIAKPNK